MEKPCSEPDCGRKHVARGLCSTHYNQHHQPNRHPKVVVRCDWCGAECEKPATTRYATRFCSLACRENHYTANGIATLRLARLDAGRQARSAAAAATRAARRAAIEASMVGRICAACAVVFDAKTTTQVVCSRRCRNRRKLQQEKARTRLPIFERDGWRCHMCRRLTRRDAAVPHPLAPTIDHLVPRSAGGTDDPSNLACACFECNCRRGTGGTVQLRLIG